MTATKSPATSAFLPEPGLAAHAAVEFRPRTPTCRLALSDDLLVMATELGVLSGLLTRVRPSSRCRGADSNAAPDALAGSRIRPRRLSKKPVLLPKPNSLSSV